MKKNCAHCKHYLGRLNFCSNMKSILFAAPVQWNETCPLWERADSLLTRLSAWIERMLND